MNSRTVIEKMPDGHLIIDKEIFRSNNAGGSAHDRKLAKRNPPLSAWRKDKAERRICRDGAVPISPDGFEGKVQVLPFGSEEMRVRAAENDMLAADSTCFAHDIVEEINERVAAFDRDAAARQPRKVKKVVIVYENDTVEEL